MTRRPPLTEGDEPADPPSLWATLSGAFLGAGRRGAAEPTSPPRRPRPAPAAQETPADVTPAGALPGAGEEPVAPRHRWRRAAVPPVPIDPRIEARRLAVAQAEWRRRRNRLLVPVTLVVLAAGGWLATRSGLLDADRLVVTGANRTSPAAVLEAAGLERGTQLVDVDATASRRRVEALLPWIASARVSRSWPGTVRVTVVERRPVAQVEAVDGRWFVVDSTGKLLDMAPGPVPTLVTIEGLVPEAVPGAVLVDRAARAVGVLDGLSPGLATRVERLRFVGVDELELGLRPVGRVALGRPEQVAQKLRDLDTVLARVDGTCLAAIDLRVPAKPLVQRNADCLAEIES